MRALEISFTIGLVAILGSPTPAPAAAETPVVSITPAQEKSESEVYFNCDHMGMVGCLQIACNHATHSREEAVDIQYLYREVSRDFPEMLTPKMRACFVGAGGKFR